MPTGAQPMGQLPPHDADAEESTIGALLLWGMDHPDPVRPPCAAWLQPNDFYREKNAWIYQAMLDLLHDGLGLDPVTLAYRLRDQGHLDAIGGTNYLIHCLAIVPTALHLDYYARIVKDMSQRRHAIAQAGQMAAQAYSGKLPPLPGPIKDMPDG